MEFLTILLYAMIFIVSVLLIALILIQPSKSGGMGAAFGGIGESVFGGKAGSHLTKTTVIVTTVFFVIALALAAFIGRGLADGKGSDVEKLLGSEAVEAPAAAAPAKVEAVQAAAPANAPAAAPAKAPAAK